MTEKARKHEGDSAFSKLTRLLRLVRFIAEHGREGATWPEIRRNVYRDFADEDTTDGALLRKFTRDREAVNASFYLDDDDDNVLPDTAIIKRVKGRYVIHSGLNLMLPMTLKKEEALALVSGVRLIPEFIPPLKIASNRLWLRMKNQMSDEILEECEYLTSATVSAIPMSAEVDHDVFMKILEAIHTRQLIRINKYAKAWPDDLESCEFSPHVIYMRHHAWYVLGKVSGKQRILRVDRIKSADLLNKPQKNPPSAEELKELERDIQLDYNPFREFPSDGWEIKLRITGTFIRPCMETEWFPGEKKTLSPDGESLIYEVKLKGLEAVTLWIMRALDCVEVLKPAELRKEIDRRVNEYINRRKKSQK